MFNSHERKTSFGFLMMRLGLAAALLFQSIPRLIGGEAHWRSVGAGLNLMNFGIPLHILGLVVLVLQAVSGLSLLTGYLFRTACALMTVLHAWYGFQYFQQSGTRTLMLFSLALTGVYLGLAQTGAGRYTVSVKLEKK
jgi:putative oxidoreductase